jgi:hypothetical protein
MLTEISGCAGTGISHHRAAHQQRLACKVPGCANLAGLQYHAVSVVALLIPAALMPRKRIKYFLPQRDDLFFGEVIFQLALARLFARQPLPVVRQTAFSVAGSADQSP